MNWMLFSAEALLLGVGGPLLMVESVREVRANAALDRRRRTLRGWTAMALALVGAYLALDRVAVSSGARSLVVLSIAVMLFLALLIAFGYPILHDAAHASQPAGGRHDASPPLFGARWDVLVLLAVAASVAAFAVAPNEVGYRIKGSGMVVAGGALYFLGRPRAARTFLLCAIAGALTLYVQWQVPWQRALGMIGQLSVGLVGLVWCARLIVRMAAESSAASRAA